MKIDELREAESFARARYDVLAKAYDAAARYRDSFANIGKLEAMLCLDVEYANVHVERAKERLEHAHQAWELADAQLQSALLKERIASGDDDWLLPEDVAAYERVIAKYTNGAEGYAA